MADALEEFRTVATTILAAIENPNTRLMYRKGLTDFFAWWAERVELLFDRSLVEKHLKYLLQLRYSSATINQRLAVIRRLVADAATQRLLSMHTAAEIARVKGPRLALAKRGRALNAAQTEALINAPEPLNPRGDRARALLALMVGCGLLRSELVRISVSDIEKVASGSALIRIKGRGSRSRCVNAPEWTVAALESWMGTAHITSGPVFRAVDRTGAVKQRALSAQSILPMVMAYGASLGIDVRPGDLRRTCAQLCHEKGGDLQGIQLLLGHASIQTTERFLDAKRACPLPLMMGCA